jgi:hypothetical protein
MGAAGRGGDERFASGCGDGQIAQLVEQGIENPRVGGSIPSLATLAFALLLGACGPPCSDAAIWVSRCESLCCEVADALEGCVDARFTWSDLGAADRDDFVRQCFAQWDDVSVDLTAYELQQATLVCRDVRRSVAAVEPETEGRCEEIRALYAERP